MRALLSLMYKVTGSAEISLNWRLEGSIRLLAVGRCWLLQKFKYYSTLQLSIAGLSRLAAECEPALTVTKKKLFLARPVLFRSSISTKMLNEVKSLD